MSATGLLAVRGVEDLVGGDATVGHPLLTTQHPDDDVRHTVLRLHTVPPQHWVNTEWKVEAEAQNKSEFQEMRPIAFEY